MKISVLVAPIHGDIKPKRYEINIPLGNRMVNIKRGTNLRMWDYAYRHLDIKKYNCINLHHGFTTKEIIEPYEGNKWFVLDYLCFTRNHTSNIEDINLNSLSYVICRHKEIAIVYANEVIDK